MFNNRIIQITGDGSHTITIPELQVTYHSRYGAIQESMHVFIQAGLHHFLRLNDLSPHEPLQIFEMGFGTGLNALLSLRETMHLQKKMFYQVIEPFPLSAEDVQALNYVSLLNMDLRQNFLQMHQCGWGEKVGIHPLFLFEKLNISLEDLEPEQKFHVIYFDAFDPGVQPNLWTENIFRKMFNMIKSNGVLVTYSSKGAVRRALQAAGFSVEKIPGPPGKREILQAMRR